MDGRRPSYPKPNRSRLGQWEDITPEDNPEAFRTPEEMRAAQRRSSNNIERLTGTPSNRPLPPSPVLEPDEAEEEAVEEDDEDEDSSELSEHSDREFEDASDSDSNGPADALDVDDENWQVGQPKRQPLSYWVPNDVSGRKALKTIKFDVDFTDKESVAKAVKTRRLELWRARERLGLPARRPSTQGREYTLINELWIRNERAAYRAANSGVQLPGSELARRYNARFPGENRTEASLASHIHINPGL